MSTNITRLVTLILNVAAITIFASQASAQHEAHQHNAAERVVTAPASLSGVVQCADGPPLPGAIVQLFAGTNTGVPAKASGLTDQAGRFQVSAPAGEYHMRVTYLGHATFERHIEIGTNTPSNIGVIRLQITAVEIDALVAAVEKERVRLRAGQTVFDVAKSTISAGGSVADALRNVPGLEISPDGRIVMRGSTSVLVLLNGQRTALKDDALVAFLKQLPASALEKIEATTSSGATQEADGTAGVVNLVFSTSDQNSKAYLVSASAATAAQYMASASAAGSFRNMTWDAGYAFSSMQPQTVSHTMRDNWLAPAELRTTHQLSIADATHRLHSLYAGSALQLGSANSLHGRVSYSWMRGSFDNHTDFADISSIGGRTGEYMVGSLLTHTIPTAEAEVGWTYRNSGPRRFTFGTTARAGGGEEEFRGDYAYANGNTFLETRMSSQRSDYAVTSEAALDVSGMRVTWGQKVQSRSVDASYDLLREGSEHDAFKHDEQVLAGYATASRLVGPVYIEAGARLETSRQRITMTSAAATERTDVQLFPSLRLHWPHETSTYRYHFAYGRRIDRPESSMLNPYSMGEDDMNSFIGNPLLRPEISQQIELGIERVGSVATIVATPFIRTSTNAIRPLKAVTETGRSTTTLQNLERTTAAGADLTASIRVTPFASVLLAGSVYYLTSRAAAATGGARNGGVYDNLRATVDVRLAQHTGVQLYAYRRSAQPVEQGEILAVNGSELALTHSFGKEERGTLSLRLSDPFNSNKLAFKVSDPTFTQFSERKTTSRMAVLSLSWNVGQKQAAHSAPRDKEAQIF